MKFIISKLIKYRFNYDFFENIVYINIQISWDWVGLQITFIDFKLNFKD
jgi:hypothetical protein